MRRRSLLLVAGMMTAALLTGCGGGDSSTDTKTPAATEAAAEDTEAVEEDADAEEEYEEDTEAVEEDADAEEAEADTEATSDGEVTQGPWWDYSDTLTVPYVGMTQAEEPVVLVFSEDMSFAVLGILDTESSNSCSFVGACEESTEDNSYLTITDETSQMTITFQVVDNGDGTFLLDVGDVGQITVAPTDQETAFNNLDIIAQYSTPVQ